MLECNLKQFKCPQQFVQFKLALRNAQALNQAITFSINNDESAADITRFLTKNAFTYEFDKYLGLLHVEPLHV
ncbi:hypothetical protein [uncultured Pseudoalteromonas sp.]|uniref:hypothetical protein n=1 Tax=uncultured Pseudoalteromonas sp. TaxID=114053 RepID=UPI0030C7A2B5